MRFESQYVGLFRRNSFEVKKKKFACNTKQISKNSPRPAERKVYKKRSVFKFGYYKSVKDTFDRAV